MAAQTNLQSRRRLGAVVAVMKLSERCNLNCAYCYYYADGYPEVYKRPPLMSLAIAKQTVAFLEQACTDYDIDTLTIGFHGGEPTLLKASTFRQFCEIIVSTLSGKAKQLHMTVQTNGVHITDEWIDVISDFNIQVGVSLDGPAEYNDKDRRDHRGAGSYARIRATIEKLNALSNAGRIAKIGVIAVLNHAFDYPKIYDHFVNELGFKQLSFRLPDHTVDTLPYTDDEVAEFGQAYCDIFELWLMNDQDSVFIRQFADLFLKISLHSQHRYSHDQLLGTVNIVIHSDGDLELNDEYMAAMDWYKQQQTYNVKTSSFKQWLGQPIMADIVNAYHTLPDACRSCRYREICGGGALVHRFSKQNRFNNKSAYCAALLKVYAHVEATLIEGGYPFDETSQLASSGGSDAIDFTAVGYATMARSGFNAG